MSLAGYAHLGVDLELPPGGVLALLGPNGAGKTTTMYNTSCSEQRTCPGFRELGVAHRGIQTCPCSLRGFGRCAR
jgi:ABC-type hemin transport system ATPase subunit